MSRPTFDEIAKITRDLNYTYLLGYKRLITRDEILNIKGGGDLKLYETVAQDDQVKSCVQQRISAVVSRDWGVEPGDESRKAKQAAEFIEQELKNLQWDKINEKMLWGTFYGYSVAEVMWRKDDLIGIEDILIRNRRRFNFGIDLEPKLITFEQPLGEDLPTQKFWHFCCGGDNDDDPYGRGLAHWLYWPTFFKRSDMRWWVIFLEKYAQPSRLGKYAPGASELDKSTLWDAMDAFGTNGKMLIPEGTAIELLEAGRAGGADYKEMLDICNAAISKIVLSQTMTTDNGSSRSQANVHKEVGDAVFKADADLVCSSFNQSVIKWLCDWNFPGVAYPRVWRQMDAAKDLNAEADRDTKLQGLGISLKPESIVGKYGDDYLASEREIPTLAADQVTALASIVSNAKTQGWSAELVTGVLTSSFPNFSDEAIAIIANNIGTPTPQPGTSDGAAPSEPIDLNAVSAQFAKKKCVKGISCGDACISPQKICKHSLSLEQRQKLKDFKKRAKGGDKTAIKALDDLRELQKSNSDRANQVAKMLADFELAKFTQRFESALAIDKNGQKAFQKDGEESEVGFTHEEANLMRGGILTHNHPDGWSHPSYNPRSGGHSFSPEDISTAAAVNLSEIRAVSPKYIHIMKRPADGWPDANVAYNSIKQLEKQQQSTGIAKILDARKSNSPVEAQKIEDTMNADYWHDLMTTYAKTINAGYTRTEHRYKQS